METLEQLKAIIENAPMDSTHYQLVDGESQYFENEWNGFLCCDNGDLTDGWDILNIRSLSDIKETIKLREMLANHGVFYMGGGE